MALHGDLCKGAHLLTRLALLARKRHPFANKRASRARLDHVDLLFENAAAGSSTALPGVPPPFPNPPGDSLLCRLLQRIALPAPRRDCAAALMHGRLLNDEAALLQ